MIPQLVLVSTALFAAWRPAESHPETSVVLAGAALLLIPWAWQKTDSAEGARIGSALLVAAVFVTLTQAGGWDRSQAVLEAFLAAGILVMAWLASREAPKEEMITLLSLGIAALSVWGLLQAWGGLEAARPALDGLPEHLKVGAVARIDQGRAFASLFLPSHLSALLATILPLLLLRVRRDVVGIVCGLAAILAIAGLVATRSPVGAVLAMAVFTMVTVTVRRRRLYWVFGAVAFIGLATAGLRPDVLRLEPIFLRVDNWASALWVFASAPITGVGFGGFGQAAQTVPWNMGNHPLHAHSMPLEWLAEGGLFGLLTWMLLAWWLIKRSSALWEDNRGLAVALLVIPAHNLVDFSLYTSGVALPWALLLGWSMAAGRPPAAIPEPAPVKYRVVPVVGAALALAVALMSAASSLFSAAAHGEDAATTRFAWAMRAAEIAPWRSEPVEVVGTIALETGNPELLKLAMELVEERHWQRPRSASRAQLWGRLAVSEGDMAGGVTQMWRAAQLQPFDSRRRRDLEELVDLISHDSR